MASTNSQGTKGVKARRAGGGARLRAAGAGVVLLLVGHGCVRLEQQIAIRGDGSATFTYHYSVADETRTTLTAGRREIERWQGRKPGPGEEDLNWVFSKDAAFRHFTGKGVRLETYRAYAKDGRHHVEVVISAENAHRALQTRKFGAFSLSRTSEGHILFQDDIVRDIDPAPLNPEQLARVRQLCDGLWLRFALRVPGKILSSTAGESGRGRATWVLDPQNDPQILVDIPRIMLRFESENATWLPAD